MAFAGLVVNCDRMRGGGGGGGGGEKARMTLIGTNTRPSISILFLLLAVFTVTASDSGSSSSGSPSSHIVSPSLLLPSSSFGKEAPVIDYNQSPSNISVSVGRTAVIKCRIKDLGQKSVSWIRHNDVSLISVGKFQYIKDDRIQIAHEPHAQDWLLIIKDVKFGDEGIYECQVNTSPVLKHQIYLSVVEPFTELLGGQDIFIDQHSSINLTCIVRSPERPAHIFWMHDEKPLQPSSPTAQSPSSRHQFSPLLPSSPSSSSSSFSPPGSPPVRISVERTDPPQSASTVSYLVIRDARPSDSGVYHCSPSNTKPASLAVHVLDGESPDALQTSGLSTFFASKSSLVLLFTASTFTLFL